MMTRQEEDQQGFAMLARIERRGRPRPMGQLDSYAARRLLEAGDELADKLWVLRCNSTDPLDRAAAERAFLLWVNTLRELR